MTGRKATITALVLAGVVVVGLAARALGADTSTSAARPARTITVTSTATEKTAPDEAIVSLGVKSESTTSTGASSQNAKDMQAVLDAVQKAGVAKADIKTTGFNLYQQTKNHGKTTVFVVSEQADVTIRDLNAVGTLIDDAVTAGADQVNDIRFEVSDTSKVKTDALTQAVKGARQKADALAAAAGASVTGVVTIHEDNSQFPIYHSLYASDALVAAPSPTPIVPPQNLETRVTITVVWAIG